MSQTFIARRLDVAAFAAAGGQLSGADPLQKYERLMHDLHATDNDSTLKEAVHWQATGERRSAVDGSVRPALHLRVQASLPLTCQRCLGEVLTPVDVDRYFIFVPDEETAAALDDESEDDVLALEPSFDLHALIEDELLMALPLVPRHEQCPEPVTLSVQDPGFDAPTPEKPNPFAALAQLKGVKKDGAD